MREEKGHRSTLFGEMNEGLPGTRERVRGCRRQCKVGDRREGEGLTAVILGTVEGGHLKTLRKGNHCIRSGFGDQSAATL